MLHEKFAEAIEVGEQALALAEEVGDDDVRAGSMLNIGASRVRISGWESGIGLMERALEVARDSRSWQRIRALGMLRDTSFEHGDLARAAAFGEEGLEEARRAGHTVPIDWLTGERAYDLYHAGDWDGALRLLDASLERLGDAWWYGAAVVQLRAAIHLARGSSAAAAEDAARALELARDGLDPQVLYPSLACSAVVEHAAGNPPAAARHADELLAAWSARPGQEPRATWVFELALVLLRLGRAQEFVAALGPVALASPWVEASVMLGAGRPAEAADILTQIGSRPYAAFAHLEAGRALGRNGTVHLETAAAFWRSVGATRYVNEAEALRAAAG
jgi:tetratricopeptide (TPR) repeat protein